MTVSKARLRLFSTLFSVTILIRRGSALSAYLDSLATHAAPTPIDPSDPKSVCPEEFFGFTNPMANCWPGSQHAKYGGYLENVNPRRPAWETDNNSMASSDVPVGFEKSAGGYLDTLRSNSLGEDEFLGFITD